MRAEDKCFESRPSLYPTTDQEKLLEGIRAQTQPQTDGQRASASATPPNIYRWGKDWCCSGLLHPQTQKIGSPF